MGEVVVRVEDVVKDFALNHDKSSSLKSRVLGAFKKKRAEDSTENKAYRALDGISFNIKKGEFFGIVGRNGSGKSTLLKIISEIYRPNSGKVSTVGKLVPFIELGVGFNPELTGRENVFLNGALLGFSRQEIEEKYDDIVSFAELERFMDQKLKNYSSGMQVRLAFSVAIKAQGDVLIFDEVLAVGDEAFQAKCDKYFEKVKQDKTKTVILVTHSMDSVKRYCDRALMIKGGKIVASGSPEDVSSMYELENLKATGDEEKSAKSKVVDEVEREPLVDNFRVEITSPEIIDQDEDISLRFRYDVKDPIDTYVDVTMVDAKSRVLILNDSSMERPTRGAGPHEVKYSCDIARLINDRNIKIYASVFNAETGDKLTYTQDNQSPVMLIRRTDSAGKRAERAKMAVLHTRGEWDL